MGKFKEGEPDFGIHIGNMCTINTMNQFPMNIAAKGIGLLPKSKYIEEITLRAEELLKRTFIEGKESTFKERISFLKEFFEKDLIDKRSIASLEIYGKTSYNNVIVNPYCALLFNSYISNLSIQLNTIAECLSEDTWEYRFIAARHDLYHIPKKNKANKFICAYRFWVIGAINKSPGKFAGEIII